MIHRNFRWVHRHILGFIVFLLEQVVTIFNFASENKTFQTLHTRNYMRKISMIRLLHALAFVLVAIAAGAADFTVDGINYSIKSRADKTVSVTWASSSYQGDIVIPATITANDTVWTVSAIGDFAFMQESKVKSVKLPTTINYIGNGAFAYCTGLTEMKLPAAIRHLGNVSLAGCSAIKHIEMPDSLYFMGTGALSYTAIDTVRVPAGLTTLPAQAFEQCTSLKCVILPEGITSFGFQAFQNDRSLTSIVLPSTLETIGNNCFAFCGLTSMHFPAPFRSYGDNALTAMGSLKAYTVDAANEYFKAENGILYSKDGKILHSFPLACGMTTLDVQTGVDSIADFSFYGCALTSITLPSSVRGIGKSAFCTSSEITTFVVPDAVTVIGPYSFSTCTNLKEVTLGSSLSKMGTSAFGNTKALRTVISRNNVPPVGAKFTNETYTNGKLFVPTDALDSYKEADGWKEFLTIKNNSVGMTTDDMTSISFADGAITVECEGMVPVMVYDMAGKCIYRGIGSARIEVASGATYIVRAGNKTEKVLLR